MKGKIKPKILIIEDDEFLRDLLAAKFREAGFEVFELANAEDNIVQKVADIQPDIILSCVVLPGIDGWEVIRLLKKDNRTKDVPFVFLTSLGQKEDIENGIKMGAIDYLIKAHHTPKAIIAYIKSYLENPMTYKKVYLHEMERMKLRKITEEFNGLMAILEDLKEKIKNWLIKNWLKTAVIIVVLIMVGGGFYWYEWRPTQIRKECYDSTIKNPFNFFNNMTETERRSELNFMYNNCLKMNGLAK